MVAFCVGEFHLCEQAAFKRIRAAHAARRFPEILEALEDGRLHLSAVVLLSPHLTEETGAELIGLPPPPQDEPPQLDPPELLDPPDQLEACLGLS